ncbi:MAG: dihydrolipoamide acetyltransferase family protein [Gammaproteobacteria bacterium]
MRLFKLPDLGEGLVEAEIVQWHIAEGEEVKRDQPLVAVETAKAIVDIPSPETGRIVRLYGQTGDILHIGDPLVEFDTGEPTSKAADAGTVVGRVETGRTVMIEPPATVGRAATGAKTTPAVRALAHRLNVDLSIVTPTGPDDTITAADVQRVAKILAEVGPLEPLRGARRSMARAMAQAHAEVVPVTVCEDADIHAWKADEDVSLRLIRALVAGCKAEPALNTWYDGQNLGRRVLNKIDLGIAVDTPEGLFVPVLREVGTRDRADLRSGLNAIKQAVKERTIPPEELRGYTIILSNFGTFAGRYADPVVMPPTVAILGAGKIRPAVVPADGQPQVHRILPLSLTFDHRAVTGGEATRFLAAVIMDLEKPE